MTANNSKYPESPRRLPYLRELLALVAVVLTTINVFATTSTTSGRRVRIRTYVESPTAHGEHLVPLPFAELFEVLYSPLTAQPKTVCVVPSDADADTTNIWTSADSLRLQRVAMTPEESVHYNLDTNAGGVEWVSVLPHGRGVVFLNSSSTSSSSDPSSHSSVSARNGNGKAPYRVAMFHQLDCLNVLREEMVLLQHTRTRTSTHSHTASESQDRAQFCLNYLRESILCHADSHLERVRSEFGLESEERGRGRGRAVVLGTERTDCVDWEGVWRGVEENWGEVMREEGREG